MSSKLPGVIRTKFMLNLKFFYGLNLTLNHRFICPFHLHGDHNGQQQSLVMSEMNKILDLFGITIFRILDTL